MNKKEIRKEIIKKRKKLSQYEVEHKSKIITKKIIDLNLINKDMNILLYSDYKNEVKTKYLIEYILKYVGYILLPKVEENNTLSIHKVINLDELKPSNMNILEPTTDNIISYKDIDLIIAPGVAFDKNMNRLGYGGGYYDRLLTNINETCKVIAIAYDLQIKESIPTDKHDKLMDYIITETSIFNR